MGLYGSPDVSNLYTEPKYKEEKKKKRKANLTQLGILVVLYLLMIWVAEDRFYTTISYVGVMSIVYFIVNFLKMIVNLFKRKKVRSQLKTMLISMVLIIIAFAIDWSIY